MPNVSQQLREILNHSKYLIRQQPNIAKLIPVQKIDNHMRIYTREPRTIEVDQKSLRLYQNSEGKSLVMMLPWFYADEKHLKKYIEFFLDLNCDVAVAQISFIEFLVPTKGAQVVAGDIVKFLANNEYYKDVILNGYSMGGYFWGECLLHIQKDMVKYQQLVDRVKAQIWDSIANVEQIHLGIPQAYFHSYPILEKMLQKMISFFLWFFYDVATRYYAGAGHKFFNTFVPAPGLIFASKTDCIGTIETAKNITRDYTSNHIDMTMKIFEDSSHVGHFVKYKDEYTQTIINHLKKAGLKNVTDKDGN